MLSVCSRVIYDRVQNGKKYFNLVFNLLMPKKLMEINQILDHGILEDHKKGGLHPKFLVDICFEIKLFCNLFTSIGKKGEIHNNFYCSVPYHLYNSGNISCTKFLIQKWPLWRCVASALMKLSQLAMLQLRCMPTP